MSSLSHPRSEYRLRYGITPVFGHCWIDIYCFERRTPGVRGKFGGGGWQPTAKGASSSSEGSSGDNNYKMNQFNGLCEFQLNNNNTHHGAIMSICYKEPDFNFCVLRELSKNAEEGLFDDCWKAYYMDKYDLIEEEYAEFLAVPNCLGEFYKLLPQLKITNPKEQIKLCKNNDNGSVRECQDCSAGQKTIVNLDHDRAREMLKCAADKLYNYDGNSPSDVKSALEANFGGVNKEIFAEWLSWLMKYMRFISADCNYIKQLEGQGNCDPNTDAWTFVGIDVRLCEPNYWDESDPIKRSRTIIHEWFHKYYISNDWEYNWSPKYMELSTLKHLTNADSFAKLVYDLCK